MTRPNAVVPSVTVLNYHSILPAGSRWENDQHAIPLDRLMDQLDRLEACGFVNVPLRRAFSQLVDGRPPSVPQQYALTFDDGYEDLAVHLPSLARRTKPTVFLLTRCAGESNLTWNTRTSVERRHLTVQQIRMLAGLGVEMEFHGTDHHNLLKFDDHELHRRFREGRDWFQQVLGATPSYVAYPYGYCDRRVERIAADYFAGGFTVTHGAWYGPAARYALNRFSVPAYLTGNDLVEVLHSAPDDRWYETERRAPWRVQGGRP